MKQTDLPYLTDWFAVSLRWLVLLGLTISLSLGESLKGNDGSLNLIIIAMLCLPALWNGWMSVLVIYNRRLRWHRQINTLLDTAFSTVLFWLAGGMPGPVFWAALLPVFTAAVYFAARGALAAAAVMSLLQTSVAYLLAGSAFQPFSAGMLVAFNLVSGVLVALLCSPLIGSLRRAYQRTVSHGKENEKQAQLRERNRMKSLFEMIETLSATINYQTVLETLLSTSIKAIEADPDSAAQMSGAVLLFGGSSKLEMHAVRGFIQNDQAIQLPAVEGVLAEVFQTGETRLVNSPGSDLELCRLVTLHDSAAAVCIPLIRSMNAYGVLLFAHPGPGFFTPDKIENLQMLANQAVISLQNARMYQELSQEKERVLQSQEEAQKILARSLHDGPTQAVSAIAMRLSIARKLMEREPAEGIAELQVIEDLARRTTQEIRHMLFTLRPLVLESEGLVPALQAMANKMRDVFQQKVVIDADDRAIAHMDPTQQNTVFFLADEAVNNARKHAQAGQIWVRIRLAPGSDCLVVLEIIDNGVGFDVTSVLNSYDRRGSLGMIHLRERADLINGVLKIDSIPGKGTRVQITIPLSEEAADMLHMRR